jgi:hypothetical protein
LTKLSFSKASNSRWRIARRNTDRESTTLESSKRPATPRTREILDLDPVSMEDTIVITMEVIHSMEVMDITIMAKGMAMGMVEMAISIVPTQ